MLEIGDGGGEIAEAEGAQSAVIKSVGRIVARGDGVIEGVAAFGELFLFEEEFAKLFVVAGGGIIEDLDFEIFNAGAAAKALKGAAEQGEIGNRFDDEIDGGADPAAENDDVKPVAFRTAAEEMDDGGDLNEDAPRIEKVDETEHVTRPVIKMVCLPRMCNHDAKKNGVGVTVRAEGGKAASSRRTPKCVGNGCCGGAMGVVSRAEEVCEIALGVA